MILTTNMEYNPIHRSIISNNSINAKGEYGMEDGEDGGPHFKKTNTRQYVLKNGIVKKKIKQKWE